MFKKIFIVLSFPLFLFSCEEINELSEELKILKSNQDIIQILKIDRNNSMESILEIMRNRIESHNQYGMGDPYIQQLGGDRLVIELAGVTDISKAKDYVQRTAEFELTLVENSQIFKDLIFQIDDTMNNDYKLQHELIPAGNRILALDEDVDVIISVPSGSPCICQS